MTSEKKKPKKRKKVTFARKLYLKAERLWKEVCFLRDGKECQVKKHFPQIKVRHTHIMQVDHCFSRADKNLFFNPHNGTVVCSACNQNKHYKNKGIDKAIDLIVMRREGEVYGQMMDIHQTHPPNWEFKKVWYLERVVKELEEYKQSLTPNKE